MRIIWKIELPFIEYSLEKMHEMLTFNNPEEMVQSYCACTFPNGKVVNLVI